MTDAHPLDAGRFEDELTYVLSHTRGVRLFEGFDPFKSSVQIDTPGDSPFKGIRKARPLRPLEHASMGVKFVEIELRNYVKKQFPATTLREAMSKAASFVRDFYIDETEEDEG